MRAFVYASAISLAFSGTAAAAPKRVASLNLCTDELLLMLAEPRQILSVTHLAQRPAETPLWKVGQRYRRNDGTLLSVAGLKPDLVITMGGGVRDRVRIAQTLGIRILDVPYAQSLADVQASISLVANALGRPAAGNRLIGQIQGLQRTAPKRLHDTVWLGGGGRSLPATGLAADWMRLAGLRQRPLQGDRVSLEQLLVKPPAILLRSDYRQEQYSGEQRWLSHPLAKGTRKSRNIRTDGRRWTCMGPLIPGEIVRLRKLLSQ